MEEPIEITEREVKPALADMKKGKATGPSGIKCNLLHAAGDRNMGADKNL